MTKQNQAEFADIAECRADGTQSSAGKRQSHLRQPSKLGSRNHSRNLPPPDNTFVWRKPAPRPRLQSINRFHQRSAGSRRQTRRH